MNERSPVGAPQPDSLQAVGDQIASFAGMQLGTGPSQEQLAGQRARLIRWEQEQRGHATTSLLKPLLWGGGLAAAAAVLLVLSFGLKGPGPLLKAHLPEQQGPNLAVVQPETQPTASSFGAAKAEALHATLNGRALSADSWVNAEAGPVSVEFSDLSQVALAEGARARLAELSSDSVRFTVESGELTASVTPGGQHEWVFRAGPYTVMVLGTVLRVAWEPESEVLSVAVSRGKVSVSGGSIEAERTVAAGEIFSVSPPVPLPTTAALPGPETSRRPANKRAATAISAAPESSASDDKSVPMRPETNSPESWKALAERGEYKRALQAAQQQGIATLVGRADAADLLLLADTARLAGAVGQASSVLHELRRRYPGHPNAQVAAFTLGRMAYDIEHDDKKAIHWFRTYLQASPSGSLAGAARGRLMLSLSRLGDRTAAAAAAKIYLLRHPRGPHAGAARSLLSNQ